MEREQGGQRRQVVENRVNDDEGGFVSQKPYHQKQIWMILTRRGLLPWCRAISGPGSQPHRYWNNPNHMRPVGTSTWCYRCNLGSCFKIHDRHWMCQAPNFHVAAHWLMRSRALSKATVLAVLCNKQTRIVGFAGLERLWLRFVVESMVPRNAPLKSAYLAGHDLMPWKRYWRIRCNDGRVAAPESVS